MTTAYAASKPDTKEGNAPAKPAQIGLTRRSPAYWRVTFDNPQINVMGPETVELFQEVINALESDEHVRVVVFDSAVDDYFLNHSDFNARLEDLISMSAGPTGLPPRPDFLVRLTRLPVASRDPDRQVRQMGNRSDQAPRKHQPAAELGAGWDACIASLGRPAAQVGIKVLMERGLQKPGDAENRLGYYLGQIPR